MLTVMVTLTFHGDNYGETDCVNAVEEYITALTSIERVTEFLVGHAT